MIRKRVTAGKLQKVELYLRLSRASGPCTCLGADDAADTRPELDQRSISGPGHASRRLARSPPSVRQRVLRPGSRKKRQG